MRRDELMTLHANIAGTQSATELHNTGLHTNPAPDGQSFPWPPQGFWLFSLLETCSGSSRGEATISQSLHIASAAKCNWLKGC